MANPNPQPVVAAPAANPPVAQVVALTAGYTFQTFLADVNGATGYSEDKAALGTTREGYFLQVPNTVQLPATFQIGNNPLTTDQAISDFLAVNYVALTGAGVVANEATFLSLLRMHIVRAGMVATNLVDRCVYVDEYVLNVAPPAAAPTLAITKELAVFVADYWQNMVAVCGHVFRVRGHHYKPEYQNTYERTWKATTITPPTNVVMPSWERIATAGIHCFGIRALHEIREFTYANHQLSRALVVRRDAPCAGSAPVRTTAAALASMRGCKWWATFYTKYKDSVDAIFAQATALAAVGTRAHINARLYNWNDGFVGIDETNVRIVAPYVMGWIDTLDPEEPITKQAAITKRATGGSAIRSTFATVLLNQAKADKAYQSVEEYLKN